MNKDNLSVKPKVNYKYKKEGVCCFCGKPLFDGGCNPDPVVTDEKARCCHECDVKIVWPNR